MFLTWDNQNFLFSVLGHYPRDVPLVNLLLGILETESVLSSTRCKQIFMRSCLLMEDNFWLWDLPVRGWWWHFWRAEQRNMKLCSWWHSWSTVPPSDESYLIFGCCWVASVMSDSVRPWRRQPTRLPHLWDSPGKNTEVGCHFLLHIFGWVTGKSLHGLKLVLDEISFL